jgi:hypothetical protein
MLCLIQLNLFFQDFEEPVDEESLDVEFPAANVLEEDGSDFQGEEEEDDEYVPEKKVLTSKRGRSRKSKPGRKPKAKKVIKVKKKKPGSAERKEKENRLERLTGRSAIKEEELDTRIFQVSLARRVPMPDPLKTTNIVEPIPSDVKKVKLVVSSRKRNVASSNILEPITQLKEVDSNSLESGSSKGVFEASKKTKNRELAALSNPTTRYIFWLFMFFSITLNLLTKYKYSVCSS